MSATKSFLTLLFLPVLLVFLLGWTIYWRFWAKKPKFKKIKPKHPVKIIPKYAKNKIYLSKYYKNPWNKRKKPAKSKINPDSQAKNTKEAQKE